MQQPAATHCAHLRLHTTEAETFQLRAGQAMAVSAPEAALGCCNVCTCHPGQAAVRLQSAAPEAVKFTDLRDPPYAHGHPPWPGCCPQANRWLSLRLELLGDGVVFATAILASIFLQANAGLAGLAMTSALNMCGFLNWMVRSVSEMEVGRPLVLPGVAWMACCMMRLLCAVGPTTSSHPARAACPTCVPGLHAGHARVRASASCIEAALLASPGLSTVAGSGQCSMPWAL